MKGKKDSNGILTTHEAADLARVTIKRLWRDYTLGRIKAEPRQFVPQRLKFRREEVERYAKTIKRDS